MYSHTFIQPIKDWKIPGNSKLTPLSYLAFLFRSKKPDNQGESNESNIALHFIYLR